MRNYVLVLILCGFSIHSYLSQDNRIYTFYPGSSAIKLLKANDVGNTDQVQYAPVSFPQLSFQSQNQGKLHIQVPRQVQYEVQTGLGSIRGPNDNLVRATYFNSPQQDTKQFEGDPVLQIIKQIIGAETMRLNLNSPITAVQEVRLQSSRNQFSGQSSQGGTENTFVPEQHSPQYQNLAVPSSQFAQIPYQQNSRIASNQYQTLPNNNPDREQYTYQISESTPAVNSVERQPVNKDNYQPLSAFGNSQNSSLQTAEPLNQTKKPLSINHFAADLYITRKPCEICCKVDEIRPCSGCCSVTPLLNSRTLKTAVG